MGGHTNLQWTRESPLTQGRGLKLVYYAGYLFRHVAPHAGAWIETSGF